MEFSRFSLFILLLFLFDFCASYDDDLLDDISSSTSNSTSQCDSTQFQCISTGKCIDGFKFCDYIVDCPDDLSDEAECGTCNFRNGIIWCSAFKELDFPLILDVLLFKGTCGWMNVPYNQGGNWSVDTDANALTTPSVTQQSEFDLSSPNLGAISYVCRVVILLRIVSKTGNAVLYVSVYNRKLLEIFDFVYFLFVFYFFSWWNG